MEIPKSKAESEIEQLSAKIERYSFLISYLTKALEQITSQSPGATIAAVNSLENMLYNLMSEQLFKEFSNVPENLEKLHELSEEVQCKITTISDLEREILDFIFLLKTIRGKLKHDKFSADVQKVIDNAKFQEDLINALSPVSKQN